MALKQKAKEQKRRIIFSLDIKQELKQKGIEPILETDNFKCPGFKCWIYANDDGFAAALDEIMEGRRNGKS